MLATERMSSRYSLRDGASFVEQAKTATFDLVGDEGSADRQRSQLSWDKKKKKFVQGGGIGSDNVKLVRTENGTRLPASYRSGRFDEWKSKTHTSLPRIGDTENPMKHRASGSGGKRFKHNKIVEAKPLDKLAKDYDRKVRQQKKRSEGEPDGQHKPASPQKRKNNLPRRFAGKSLGRVKSELKTVDQVRKARKVLDNRRAKNARPSKKSRR